MPENWSFPVADGPDQVRGPVPINKGGGLASAPIRQAQLRTTSALWTKSRIVQRYLDEGVIAAGDVRLIAIGAGRFLYSCTGRWRPSAHPVIGVSDRSEYVTINREDGQVVDQGFHLSDEIERQGGAIPRTAFISDTFTHVSGVIWSRISIGNISRRQRPLTFVHNPMAVVPMPQRWGVWDREYVTSEHDGAWETVNILADGI